MAARVLLVHSLTALLLSSPVLAGYNCTFSQYYNSTTSQCSNCSISCNACSDSTSCSICASGYFMATKSCIACATPNCAVCPNNTCTSCNAHFEITESAQCVPVTSAFFMAYLIGSICLGIIILVSCCCYCINRCRDRFTLSNMNRAAPHPLPIRAALPLHLPAEAVSQLEIRFDETWREDDDFSQRKKEMCPFCLDPLVNLQLPCRHLYHLACIAQWLHKHSECPVCKRHISGQAKLYCSECFSFDIKFHSSLITANKVMEKRICERCAMASQQIIIQVE